MVTPLWLIVYRNDTDEFPDSTNPMSKPNSAWIDTCNWSCGHFVIFLPILAKNWLPWQCTLDRCNQKCLLWIGRPGKPPVISNYILAISRTSAFYALIAILVPKLVAMVTPVCPLYKWVSQMNFPLAQTQSQTQALHECVAYDWRYGHFLWFFWLILAKIWLPW